MSEKEIRDRLVEHGQTLFHAPKQLVPFTKVSEADALLNDLINNPHAFVLACVMDRQIKAEKAWLIPYRISVKIHGFSIAKLSSLSVRDVNRLMKEPEPLHRFVDKMSRAFHSAVQRIATTYSGDASQIWSGKPSSAEVVYRFLEFDGIGPKIGSMAANILAREFKIPFADYFSIDISADVHVRRVFSRLGLCSGDAAVEQVIYKAKALYPEFPGIMDLPCWEIGRNWCKSRGPECHDCYMSELCPTSKMHGFDLTTSKVEAKIKKTLNKDNANEITEKRTSSIPVIINDICEGLGKDGKTIARKDILAKAKLLGINPSSVLPADYCDNTKTGKWSQHSFLHSIGHGIYVLRRFSGKRNMD